MVGAIFKASRLLAHENLYSSPIRLGERGIGAVGAVRAVTEETMHLVLFGYSFRIGCRAEDELWRKLTA